MMTCWQILKGNRTTRVLEFGGEPINHSRDLHERYNEGFNLLDKSARKEIGRSFILEDITLWKKAPLGHYVIAYPRRKFDEDDPYRG